MKVSIIGAGYVGLVSGACLAEKGHDVTCVDVEPAKVECINSAESPIFEDGLADLLRQNVPDRLRATTDLCEAVRHSDVTLIAVGTPFNGTQIDLRYIRQAALEIGAALRSKADYHVVAVKSTVVPGTTEDVVLPELERASGKQAGADFGVVMNPEFLREGEAVADFMAPDRIVMGGIDDRSISVFRELYSAFETVDVVITNCRTAEMIKYTANSLLATMISFSNEIGNLCAATGNVDVVDVMQGVHLDKRLSPILASGERIVPSFTTYIEAGCGFGGSCFPKDVKALCAYGDHLGSDMSLLDAVLQTNATQPLKMVEMVEAHFSSLEGIRVAVLGLAFKPGSDDIRESPAIAIVGALLEAGASVTTFDPIVEALPGIQNKHLTPCDSIGSALADAEAVLLITSWSQFEELPSLLKQADSCPLVVDGRRMLDKQSVRQYAGIGL